MAKQYSFEYAVQAAAPLIAAMVALKLVELLTRWSLGGYGIAPRELKGALGILAAPLLHGSLAHLASNIGPLFVLLVLLFWDKTYHPSRTLAMIWLASGIGTWAIGRGEDASGVATVHIGASSLIFGLVAYLIAAGVLAGKWRTFFVAVLVLLVFGSIYVGVLPHDGPISWEGHLSGAVAGLLAAFNNHGKRAGKS